MVMHTDQGSAMVLHFSWIEVACLFISACAVSTFLYPCTFLAQLTALRIKEGKASINSLDIKRRRGKVRLHHYICLKGHLSRSLEKA
jgi:hypothetical protein